jgi:hypothetical protein
LAPTASLRELADAAPAPWGDILREHRAAFLTATEEISALAQSNKELLSAGYRAARESLMSFSEPRPRPTPPTGRPCRACAVHDS